MRLPLTNTLYDLLKRHSGRRIRGCVRALLLLACCRWWGVGECAEPPAALSISSAPACTQCHLVWLEDFVTTGAEILVPYRRDKGFESGTAHAESSELMCYSCHDGYVADSRVRIRSGFQHPMAGISRLGRKRPRPLPLLQEETVYCGTCHTPHGPGQASDPVELEGNAFLRMAERPGPVELCILCHDYATTAGEMGNHIVGRPDDPVPKPLQWLGARTNTERGGIGCQTCHSPHGATNRLLVILGGNDGSSVTLCTMCHASDFSKQGLGLYSHPVGVPLALEADAAQYPNGERIHLSAGATMNCLSCHDVHESRVPERLLRYSAPGSGLCRTCHADPYAIRNTPHDLRAATPDAKNVLGQTASQGGICSPCHVPHKGRLPFLWAHVARGGRHPIDRLCLSCHGVGGAASKRINSRWVHPTPIDKRLIRREVDPSDISFTVPVYDDAGQPAERGAITCLTCHDAHHWQPQGEARVEGQEPPHGEGTPLNSFTRRRSDNQICKHCHGVWALWRYRYYHSPLRSRR